MNFLAVLFRKARTVSIFRTVVLGPVLQNRFFDLVIKDCERGVKYPVVVYVF